MVIAILLFVAVVGLVLFLTNLPKHMPSWGVAAMFLFPAIILICFGLIYPAIVTFKNSFYGRDGTQGVGWANYIQIFTEPQFLRVLLNSVLWTVLVPLLSTAVGLIYSVVVDRTRFEKLAKTLIFLPMAISMVGASIIWKFVYDQRVGLLSAVYTWVAKLFGHTVRAPQWLMNAPLNTFLLIFVMIWIEAGYAMTVLSTAIKGIPEDLVEAARLDGLNAWQQFIYLTIPMIRPSIVVVITTVAMAGLKSFDIVRTMTAGNYDTSVIANEFYTQSFLNQNTGLGAALAVLMFIIVIPVVVFNVRQLRKSQDVR
ncbi:sugar ABC transporter permease [Bifidobacterium sp. ESL0690]|uniref:carbohydrate ABC transporter permease n=1 Tax=Bifidobacterium sp. ESL0690 TaxID=2983214 RepID=UPI0023F63461|nr:sugar ABC transporter permease [Bifidobacterium sp. ESL0690]WEV47576.1 sugar ABC transporter permease [Bifidobacterium sp. ESL0690]